MSKIVFVISLVQSGGAEKRAILISNLLKKHYETKVFAFSGEKNQDIDYIYKDSYNEYKKESISSRVKVLSNYLSSENPDFVVSFMPHVNMMTTLAIKKTKQKQIKHIVAITDCKFKTISTFALKYSLRRASMIYYQCSDQLKYINPRKTPYFIIPNPIKDYCETKKDNKYKFISVGRLEDQKGQDLLISAFKEIKDAFPMSTFDIYGDGSKKELLNNQIIDLNLSDSVFIHNYTDSIDKEYASHDVFLFGSKREGFPSALAEAMANKLICFTTHFETGCGDLIKNNETGYVLNSRDPKEYAKLVIDKLSDYDSANKVAAKGFEHVKKLCSTDAFIDNFCSMLAKIK